MWRKVAYNGLADFMLLGAGIISSLVLTRALGPEDWGRYSQLLWLVMFGATLFGLGMTYTSVRFLSATTDPAASHEQRPLFVWLVIAFGGSIAVGALLQAGFASWWIALAGWRLNPDLIRLAALLLVPAAFVQLGQSMLRGLQMFDTLAKLASLLGLAALMAVAATLVRPTLVVLLVASAIGQWLLLPWMFHRIWRSLPRAYASSFGLPSFWRGAARYSTVVYLTVLVDQVVWQRSEIFFLGRLADPREAGYYGLAFTIATLAITSLPTALTGVLTPVFTIHASREDTAAMLGVFRRTIKALHLTVLPLTLGLIVVAPALIEFLYGREFVASAAPMRILALSSAVVIYARPSASMLHALAKPRVLLLGSLCALPVDLALAWFLVPRYGATGAAVANLAAAGTGGLIVMAYTRSLGARYERTSLAHCLLAATLSAALAGLLLRLMPGLALSLPLAVLVGAVAYATTMLRLGDPIMSDLWSRAGAMLGRLQIARVPATKPARFVERLAVTNNDGWPFHLTRYRFAASYVEGLVVLDIACGIGYGTVLLAENGAEQVIGMDLAMASLPTGDPDPQGDSRAHFVAGDATRLPLAGQSVEAVVSLETLEHLADAEEAMREFARVLRPGGRLVLSTPNALVTASANGRPANPFHTQEYEPHELEALLSRHFAQVRLFGQRRIDDASDRATASRHWLHRLAVAFPLSWRRGLPLLLPKALGDPLVRRVTGHGARLDERDIEIVPAGVSTAPVLIAVCNQHVEADPCA